MSKEVRESKKVVRAKAKAKKSGKVVKAKKPKKEKKMVEIQQNDFAICQNCKDHSNKPSYCAKHTKYVGRKNTCADFR